MKTRVIKSAWPIYIAAAVWLVYGMVLPIYKWQHILFAAVLSVVAYFAGSKFFPGRTVEVEEEMKTGNGEIDRELNSCADDLAKLREANAGIPSRAITEKIDRLETAGGKILKAVVDKPERFDQVRKFMKYYLPTTAKLLEQYRTLQDTNSSGQHVTTAMQSVENSLDLIAKAFDKQLDNLYQGESMDMRTDVQVLETMMASDGLTTEGIAKVLKEEQGNV
ncbi:MAG: 5-bromo-4-chloroindolyl phosphate hydrolysis family protein [Clostridia bacterium]|nr:5-bromo-4-chloroindolyl phosphate hydrolysis family protein [Clostridia bacterium]